MEYILLNPNKVVDSSPMDWRAVLGKMGKNFGKVLPLVGDIGIMKDAYDDMQKYTDPYSMWGA